MAYSQATIGPMRAALSELRPGQILNAFREVLLFDRGNPTAFFVKAIDVMIW